MKNLSKKGFIIFLVSYFFFSSIANATPLVGITLFGTLYDIDIGTGSASNPRDTGFNASGGAVTGDFVLGLEFIEGKLYAATVGDLYQFALMPPSA